jgi:site-specific recombinase XerC
MKISELAECLGHASLSTTQKYTLITQKEAIDNYDMAHPRACVFKF